MRSLKYNPNKIKSVGKLENSNKNQTKLKKDELRQYVAQ